MPSDPDGVERFYGRWARLYDVVATHTPGVARLRRDAAGALALEPGDVVLDLGCGTGANFPFLREHVGRAGRVVGVDRTPGVLDRARRRIRRAGWGNVDAVRGDATRPPVDRADAVLASFLVGMLTDPAADVGTWCGLVPPGGRVALIDARSSPRRWVRPVNGAFRAFVAATAPPTARLRYPEPPARVLDRRVEASRSALAGHGELERDASRALGFVRLTAARITA